MQQKKVKDRPMDFTVTKYERLLGIISDSTLQLTFTKPPFVTFCVVPKKNNNYLKRHRNTPPLAN